MNENEMNEINNGQMIPMPTALPPTGINVIKDESNKLSQYKAIDTKSGERVDTKDVNNIEVKGPSYRKEPKS